MDTFKTWLDKKNKSEWIKRALTDRSYKNCQNCCLEKTNPECNDTQSRLLETNTDLATYGDALIKFCYSEILLNEVEQFRSLIGNAT